MNPDFSELPLEIQYEYLLKTPYQNIIQYCRTSRSRQQICQDPRFWNQKALLDFNIPLEYAPDASTPAQKYALMKIQYDRASESLLIKLIRGGLLSQALKLYSRFIPDYEDEEEIMRDLLVAAADSGRADILSEFSRRIAPRFHNVAREAYLETIRKHRPDLTQVLAQYYSPETDPDLSEYFYSEIGGGDLAMVRYLKEFVRRDPEFELQTAFFSGHPEVLNYFLELYPHLLRDPVVVNRLAQNFTCYGNLLALQELMRRAGGLVDLEALRRNIWIKRYPQIKEYLASL